MQISYNWLKKYIELNFSPEDLAEKLTMAGLEVEGIDYLGEGLEDIIIAEIKEIKEHPNADQLVICLLNIGADKDLIPVVTGAANVKTGQHVPFAGVGSTLPGGMKIEEVKLRGELSQGMICSKDELGLQEERAAGILVLENDAPLGESFIDYKKLDDYVFNLDLTPNYSRCLGIIGAAREIKSLYLQDQKLNTPSINFTEVEELGKINDYAQVKIEDPDLCSRYTARLVKDVEVKESPEWIKRRLKSAGIRPINNVVDISNFVLLEYNQPLHTFDFNKIEGGRIIVRRAEAEEKIMTLDQEERDLDPEMLVISDPEKTAAVAGVMGGAETEVTAETTDVLIEAAYFNPVSIRKTAKKLAVHSDSSHRFERGVDIEKLIEANNRACQLLENCAGGKVVAGVIDEYPFKYEAALININVERVNKILGLNLEKLEVKESLERLGFELKEGEADFEVKVPSFRTDVEQAADLIEEIARVYGYNEIPATRPISKQLGQRTAEQQFELKVKELLRAGGLDEIITYSLQSKKDYQNLNLNKFPEFNKLVAIKNPLSEAFEILRTSLLPGIVDVLSLNARRQGSEMGVFEVGRVFRSKGGNNRPEEIAQLGGGIFGAAEDLWQQGAPNFFKLKGILEMLFERLQLENYSFSPENDNRDFLHPGRRAEIKYDKTQTFGYLGEIHPELVEENKLAPGTTIFELDFDFLFKICRGKSLNYQKLIKYPVLARDLAIVIAEDIPAGDIYEAVNKKGGVILKEINLFDIYQGDQIKEGYKSAAFGLKFQAADRTLTDQEVNEQFNQIVEHLREKYSAEIRGI